ncbi:hypothetical protein [Burkholderia sp. BCC1985]|uniref:hypothetical protein n=1 Tax=Burkholderia sp. BCC1985 TaxID=2817442 RepID=UPI002AAF71A6|nr:hypothetical protein [Burkholderia sp. BCC1985]
MVDVPNQAVNEARGPGGCGKTGQRQATSWPIVMPRRRFSIVISGPHGDKTGHTMRGAMAETGVRAGRFGCRFQHKRCAIGLPAGRAGRRLERPAKPKTGRRSWTSPKDAGLSACDGNRAEHMAAGAKSAAVFRCPGRHVSA